jgi:hypothetical protein
MKTMLTTSLVVAAAKVLRTPVWVADGDFVARQRYGLGGDEVDLRIRRLSKG